MTPEQRAAFVFAQSVAALAQIEAMKAANARRADQGYAQAYAEEDFASVADEFSISHNAVLSLFQRSGDEKP